MKIGIICASDDELAPFLLDIKDKKQTERAMLKFYEGEGYYARFDQGTLR